MNIFTVTGLMISSNSDLSKLILQFSGLISAKNYSTSRIFPFFASVPSVRKIVSNAG